MKGLPTSVRFAALTGGVFLLLLALVGVVGYRQFHEALRDPVDRTLLDFATSQVDAVSSSSDANSGSPETELLAPLDGDRPEPLTPGDLETQVLEAQVLAADGSVLETTDALSRQPGLVQGRRLVRIASGVPVHGDAVVDGRAVRFVALAVGDGTERIFVVVTSIEALRQAERTLVAVYAPVALAGSALAGLSGLWVSRRGLAPLRRITAHAEAIGAYDLSQRLPVPARRDEIGQLAQTLNRMLDRLDAAVQRERRFVTDVGHELRTPLAIAHGEIELVRQATTDADRRDGLSSALEELDQLADVADDLLLLARGGAADGIDRGDDVDLGGAAARTVNRFSKMAEARGVTLAARGEAEVRGDRRAVERALANLVDNALRHTPSGGTVEITIEPRPPGAVVTVRDSGEGVPQEMLATLFDRFTQSRSGQGGAGLGLSIVAAVAASHAGGVRARNLPESGLEIVLELG